MAVKNIHVHQYRNSSDFFGWLQTVYPDLHNHFYISDIRVHGIFMMMEQSKFNKSKIDGFTFDDFVSYIKDNEHLHEFWLL